MILEKILSSKKEEIRARKAEVPLDTLRGRLADCPRKRSLKKALREGRTSPVLIAEIKKASPSRGVIREDFRPLEIAKIYRQGGAGALSVLTDEPFFSGSLSILKEVRQSTSLPVLRKDFILDRYQVYESAVAGADAVLLIVGILDDASLNEFLHTARNCSMDALVEVHTEKELERAVDAGAEILGINNRDLGTMKVDTGTAKRLLPKLPDYCLGVAESGIRTHEDILELAKSGAHGVLIGEAFMEASDIGGKVRELLRGTR